MTKISKEIILENKTGLHARPAAIFVQIANRFECDIFITKEDQKVNGKSIMGILMLAAEKGAKIIITAKGKDAEEAVEKLSDLLSNNIENDVSL